MRELEVTAVDIAKHFIGVKEIKGSLDHPLIIYMLQLDHSWPQHDEIAWCSVLPNFVCHLLDLPRSKSLAARSWLLVGQEVKRKIDAVVGFDIVILKRGGGDQPDASVIDAPGHVGFFYGFNAGKVKILGGNQNNEVNITEFPDDRIIGIRRLYS